MRLVLHPKVYADIDEIMAYYERVASRELANEFYFELRKSMAHAAQHPQLYAVRQQNVRRVNLERFPFHFLFRHTGDQVRVLIVRHHRRHPSFGIDRV